MGRRVTAKEGRSTTGSDSTLGTRDRLLLAAEKLIAEEGVAQVPMRRINAEAGASNVSAAHYHFGSLEGIITAVFDLRMTPVERRRNEMLDELLARGTAPSVSEILQAVIWPLAEQMLGQAGINYYVRFLAAINRSPTFDTWSVVSHRNRRGLVRGYVLLRRALKHVPKDVLHTRIMLALREMIYTLADTDHMIQARHPDQRNPLVMFHAADLVTRLGCSLGAPVSEATQMARQVLQSGAGRQKSTLFGMDSLWALGPTFTAAA